MLKDCRGHQLTGATGTSLPHYETALRQLRCYIDDPVASVDEALAASPGLVMAHVLKAYLNLLGTEPAGLPVAREAHAAAARCPATEREALHVAAAGALAAGRWHAGRPQCWRT